jgi:arginase
MESFIAYEVPTDLGLRRIDPERPMGVVNMPAALQHAGLLTRLSVTHFVRVAVPEYRPELHPQLRVLNPEGVVIVAERLAGVIGRAMKDGLTPIVLGGDCSILTGSMLALRRAGRYGLLFLDGHTDFYTPEASTTGGIAGMDLAIACGRGPAELVSFGGVAPLVQPADVVHFGRRDLDEAREYGGDLAGSGVVDWPLARIRESGLDRAIATVVDYFRSRGVEGIWLHVDADVLDDAVMPAVDSRQPGGMSYDELAQTLAAVKASGMLAGVEITIFDPEHDPSGEIARALTDALVAGLGSDGGLSAESADAAAR